MWYEEMCAEDKRGRGRGRGNETVVDETKGALTGVYLFYMNYYSII